MDVLGVIMSALGLFVPFIVEAIKRRGLKRRETRCDPKVLMEVWIEGMKRELGRDSGSVRYTEIARGELDMPGWMERRHGSAWAGRRDEGD